MRLFQAVPRKTISLSLLLVIVAIAGNYSNLQLFWGIQVLFGSVAVLIAMHFHGAKWGVGVALLSGMATAFLLHNPNVMLVQVVEAVALGLAYRRLSHNLVMLDGLYWLLLGMPLTAMLQYSMLDNGAGVPLVMTLHAGINGVFNALVASLLVQAIYLWRWFGISHSREYSLTLRQSLFNLLVSATLVPALLIAVLDARHQHSIMEAGISPVHYRHEMLAPLTQTLLTLSGIIGLAFFMGWLLSRWLSNPLIQLAKESSNMRFKLLDTFEQEAFKLELPDSPLLEMENLVLNFRETAVALHKSFNELYGFAELLEMRVDERTRELSQTNEQLKHEITIRTEQTLQLGRTTAELETQKFALDQHSIVAITDQKGIITYVNDKFCQVSQYSREELLGQDHRILNSGFHPKDFFKELFATIGRGQVWQGVIRNRRKDGSFYWVDTTIVPFMDADDKPYKFVSIRTDVTERQRFEEDLIQAKEAAEQANRAKSEFLSRMSHELRTPLNAVIGFTQILESGVDGELNEGQRESTSNILQASWHLLDLISEILDLARIESGNMAITLESVELGPLLDECVDMITPLANERHVLIEDAINQAGKVYRVHADRTRLKQVLLNLMSNAVKYNKMEGTLSLNCVNTENGMLRLNVVDSGIGIPADKVGELFKPFSRLGADKSETQGAGVGLAVTKSLLELMGGRIGMESAMDKGTTFWVELVREGGSADTGETA
jgi:PAS domain S-box-containing protein